MLKMILNKKNSVVLPYRVELIDNKVIIESFGEYNESYVVFHAEITTKRIDSKVIYIRLNETVIKNIQVNVNTRDINRFSFDFSKLLTKEEINDISLHDKKILKEVTI